MKKTKLNLIGEILVEYKYSKKTMLTNVNNKIFNELRYFDNKIFESKIKKSVLELEMLFYECENYILLEQGYLTGKISLNVNNITKGRYRNKLYLSDVLQIKTILTPSLI